MSKELIERLRADAESTDDIGLCADAAERIEELERERDAFCMDYRMKCDGEFKALCVERDALQADNARLWDALEDIYMTNPCDTHSQQAAFDKAHSALFTTPEQSLAEYRNKVIEAFVNEFSRHVGGDGEFWLHELQDFAMKEQP